jgi:hypothetical protein
MFRRRTTEKAGQGQKRSQPSAAATESGGVDHFLMGEKKGLAKQDLS